MAPVIDYEVIRSAALLGEGILWDSRREALWWTDIQGKALHRYAWSSASTKTIHTSERLGSFGLVAGSEQLI